MTAIIGIVGAKGAGKTTAAKYLEQRHGARVYAFATPLKEMLRRAFDLSEEQIYGAQTSKEAVDPRYNVSPRWLMTHVGTEGCRAVFGEDFWAERTVAAIRADAPTLAVVEDVRFLSEASVLRAAGGKIWRLHRAPDIRAWEAEHQSETELEQIVADLDLRPGAGGVEHLHATLDTACRYHALVEPAVPAPVNFWNSDAAHAFGRMAERLRDQGSFKTLETPSPPVCMRCQGSGVRLRPDGGALPCLRCA